METAASLDKRGVQPQNKRLKQYKLDDSLYDKPQIESIFIPKMF